MFSSNPQGQAPTSLWGSLGYKASLTLRAGADKQHLFLPPAARFHKMLPLRAGKENSLLFCLPSPSGLSGQQTAQVRRRPNFLPKNHTPDCMCFFHGDQVTRSSTGLKRGLSMWWASSKCKCKQHYLLCTVQHKLLLHYYLMYVITKASTLGSEQEYANILPVYGFLIEFEGLIYDR